MADVDLLLRVGSGPFRVRFLATLAGGTPHPRACLNISNMLGMQVPANFEEVEVGASGYLAVLLINNTDTAVVRLTRVCQEPLKFAQAYLLDLMYLFTLLGTSECVSRVMLVRGTHNGETPFTPTLCKQTAYPPVQEVSIQPRFHEFDVRDQAGRPCSHRSLQPEDSLDFFLIWTPSAAGTLSQPIDISTDGLFPDIRIACVGFTEGHAPRGAQWSPLLAPSPPALDQEDSSALSNRVSTSSLTRQHTPSKFAQPTWDNGQQEDKPVRLQRLHSRPRRSLSRVNERSDAPSQHMSRCASRSSSRGATARTQVVAGAPPTVARSSGIGSRRLSLHTLSPAVLATSPTRAKKRQYASVTTPTADPSSKVRGGGGVRVSTQWSDDTPLSSMASDRGLRSPADSGAFTLGSAPVQQSSRMSARRRSLAYSSALAMRKRSSPSPSSSRASIAARPAPLATRGRPHQPTGFGLAPSSPSARSTGSRPSSIGSRRGSLAGETRSSSLRSSRVHVNADVPREAEAAASLAIYHTEYASMHPFTMPALV